MTTTCRELVEYVAKSIVDDPTQVTVREIEGSTSIMLELTTAPDELGRVIGRNGRVANAIRTLVRSVAARQGKRVTLEIVEPDELSDEENDEPDLSGNGGSW